MELLIKGATVVNPGEASVVRDVLIQDGFIKQVGADLPAVPQVIEGAGLCLTYGLFDMHVHFRDPGFTYKEDIHTGSAAAAAGGFTGVLCMPNTQPVCDNEAVLGSILSRAKGEKTKVHQVCAITKGLKGTELVDVKALKAAGATAFSDDGRPVEDLGQMRAAFLKAKEADALLISHCEDLAIINGGIINKGRVSEELGVPGMDRRSEDLVTKRELKLAEETGGRIHIAHVSTKGSVEAIRQAKKRGVRVTAETCPHYFTLTEEALLGRDANYRMNPPLRTEEDREAVLRGVLDGTLDAIVTDHAPHGEAEKSDFRKAPNGIVGLETSLALCITFLVRPGHLTLPQLVEKMSLRPREILGLGGGRVEEGAVADLTLFAPEEAFTVDKNSFQSKGRNTPFHGWPLYGKVKYTVVDGTVTYQE